MTLEPPNAETVCRLLVRVRTGASRSAIIGYDGVELRINLAARPIENRANEALRKFLAETLGVGISRIQIGRGQTGHSKLMQIQVSPNALVRWLVGYKQSTNQSRDENFLKDV